MGKKHKILKLAVASATTLYAVNKFIDKNAQDKNMCNDDNGDYYEWKQGNIFYTQQGSGSPLLLLHNLDVTSSSYEWYKMIKKLEKSHTVYTLDLLGCGQSDKPNLTYTNYIYVQLITDFIRDIIGEKTSVVTSADASSIAIMSNNMNPELFDRILLINPTDINRNSLEPSKLQVIEKNILFLPLIGTSLYNYYMKETNIKDVFLKEYFSSINDNVHKLIDTYYQAAHIHKSNGRYLYASKKCFYLNVNIRHALSDKDNIHILATTDRPGTHKITDGYVKENNKIEVTYLSNSKLLPQLEIPEKTSEIIEDILG